MSSDSQSQPNVHERGQEPDQRVQQTGGLGLQAVFGLAVVSAADDAAGMAIRELMRSDIAVLNQGIRNASDAISMIQTAEGAMSVIDEKLIRMKELAEQAATGTYTTAQREIMNSEYQAMAAEIDRIATATDFNGVKLLDGSLEALHSGSGLKVHFGAGNSSAEDYYYVSIGDMRATTGTGLRVGSNDTRDTWTTGALNLTSADNSFSSSDTGTFGLQYTHDGGTSWSTYGFVTVDSNDTLTSIVEEINQGAQSTTTMNFGSATLANFDTQTVTINGNVLTFDSTVAADSSTANTIGISGLATAALSPLRPPKPSTMNITNGDSGIDAVAVVSGATVTVYHEPSAPPQATTTLGTSVGSTSDLNMGTTWTATTGTHLGASAVWQDQFGYELQLEANLAGDNHQLRITNPNGDFVNNIASGVTLNTTGGGPTLLISGGTASDLTISTKPANGQQTVNGSGSTTWAAADILTQSAAQVALAGLDTAINAKDEARASLGATQNRLENTITNLQIQAENLQAAESRISDVDVATEMTTFTSNNILAQSAVAMLAQANSLPSLALSLLGG
jgi:flagellin